MVDTTENKLESNISDWYCVFSQPEGCVSVSDIRRRIYNLDESNFDMGYNDV